jgi:hypothetical protein
MYRANPDFELLLYDRLPPEQQKALEDLRDDPDFYGLLRPSQGSGLGLKSACRETALLFLTLQVPGPLPAYVRTQSGERWHEPIVQMVLDGILQIEHEGTFVSGAEAHGLFHDRTVGAHAGSVIPQLSIDALCYAQMLPLDDAQALSRRLYAYNGRPLTPAWKRQYPSSAAVAQSLGIQPGGPNRRRLQAHWMAARTTTPGGGWFAWHARHRRTTRRASKTSFKLYVSPDPASLPDAFAAIVSLSATLGAVGFKVGKNAHGLLRPDKLVIYYTRLDALAEGADRLRQELGGCPAQGVPFSAAITTDGLLSWGIDPPLAAQTPLPLMQESWRLWITNRLARALLAARASPVAEIEPWQFALDRMRLEGVDTETWAPGKRMWNEYIEEKE